MKNKGKNYANRKPESERPEGDFYPTPSCMVKELVRSMFIGHELADVNILDPCCGKHAIGNVLRDCGYKNIIERDLMYGQNFLYDIYNGARTFPDYDFIDKRKQGSYESDIYVNDNIDIIVMNPPFKEFNGFVQKAKDIADRVYCIGKMNFFGAHDRNVNGLWEHLEWVLPFDRMIAFDKPEVDGKVECGMMVSGWFIWNRYYEDAPKVKVLDMQKYIKQKSNIK